MCVLGQDSPHWRWWSKCLKIQALVLALSRLRGWTSIFFFFFYADHCLLTGLPISSFSPLLIHFRHEWVSEGPQTSRIPTTQDLVRNTNSWASL